MEEKIRQIWPDWEIDRPSKDNGILGAGSFGDVYRIRRSTHGFTEYAALKVITIPRDLREHNQLKQEYGSDAELSSYYDDVKKSFESEYATMAALRGHANIVYCDEIKCAEHPNHMGWDIHIKMELLTPLMKQLPVPFSEADTRKLGMDICQGLILCQKLDIIHRDIKPQNIFLARDGNFKLGDFGIAKHMEGTQLGTVAGTQDYMAPEVSLMQPYSCQADIYSLGLVMYWMLNNYTGPFLPTDGTKPTFSQKAYARTQRLSGKPLPPPLYGSEALKKIVLKACAFDQKQRYASAQEMRKALLALEAAPAVSPEEDRTIRDTRRKPNTPAATPVSDEDATVRTVRPTPVPQEGQKLVDLLKNLQNEAQKATPSTYSYVPPKQDAVTPTAPRQAPAEPYAYVPPKQTAVTSTPPKSPAPEPYSYVPPRQEPVTPKPAPAEPYTYTPPRQEPVTPPKTSPKTYSYTPPKQEPVTPVTPGNNRTTKPDTEKKRKKPFVGILLAVLALVLGCIVFSAVSGTTAPEPTVSNTGSTYYSVQEIGRIEDPSRDLFMAGDYISDLRTSEDGLKYFYNSMGERLEGIRFERFSSLGHGLVAASTPNAGINNLTLITTEGQVILQEDACLIQWASKQDELDPRYLLVYTAGTETADEEKYLVNVQETYISTFHSSTSGGTMYTGTLRVYDTFEDRFVPNLPTVTRNNDLAVCGNSIVIKTGEEAYKMYDSNGAVILELDVSPSVGNGYLVYNRQSTYYIIDDTGKQTYMANKSIYSAIYDEPYLDMEDKVIDIYGNVILEGYNLADMYDGLFLFYADNDKYGLVAPDGTEVFQAKYGYISDLGDGYFAGKTGNTYSLLHRDGVLVSGLESSPYDLIIEKDGMLFVLNDRSYSLANPSERYPIHLGHAMVGLQSADTGLYTVYDLFTGKPLLATEFEYVGYGAGNLYGYLNGGWDVYRVQLNR